MNKKLAAMFLSLALMASCRNNDNNKLSPAQEALLKTVEDLDKCGEYAAGLEKQAKIGESLIKALGEKDSLTSLLVDHQDQLITIMNRHSKSQDKTIKRLEKLRDSLIVNQKIKPDSLENN